MKIYADLLKANPSDNDYKFFLASAYASLKWADVAIAELKIILRSDPTDVFARHDLALCYRDKGWFRESLVEMRKANEYATIYGNAEEKEIVKSTIDPAAKSGPVAQAAKIKPAGSGCGQPGSVDRLA